MTDMDVSRDDMLAAVKLSHAMNHNRPDGFPETTPEKALTLIWQKRMIDSAQSAAKQSFQAPKGKPEPTPKSKSKGVKRKADSIGESADEKAPKKPRAKKAPKAKPVGEAWDSWADFSCRWNANDPLTPFFQQLKTNGFVVIPKEVLVENKESLQGYCNDMGEAKKEIEAAICCYDDTMDPANPETWNKENKHPGMHGLVQYSVLGNSSGAWRVSSNEHILNTLAKLEGCPVDDLIISTDAINYGFPTEKSGSWPHADQGVKKPLLTNKPLEDVKDCKSVPLTSPENGWTIESGLWTVQGQVPLTAQNEQNGCLLVWKGSHVYHQDLLFYRARLYAEASPKKAKKSKKAKKEEKQEDPEATESDTDESDEKKKKSKGKAPDTSDWVRLDATELAFIESRCPKVYVQANPGDLVLWLSTTIHQGHLGKEGEAKEPRVVRYICGHSKNRIPKGQVFLASDLKKTDDGKEEKSVPTLGKPLFPEVFAIQPFTDKEVKSHQDKRKKQLIKKQREFLCGRTTSHDPTCSKVFSLRPRTYSKDGHVDLNKKIEQMETLLEDQALGSKPVSYQVKDLNKAIRATVHPPEGLSQGAIDSIRTLECYTDAMRDEKETAKSKVPTTLKTAAALTLIPDKHIRAALVTLLGRKPKRAPKNGLPVLHEKVTGRVRKLYDSLYATECGEVPLTSKIIPYHLMHTFGHEPERLERIAKAMGFSSWKFEPADKEQEKGMEQEGTEQPKEAMDA